jgi:transposase
LSAAARLPPQTGQTKPLGQRRSNKNAAQRPSSGKACWNSVSDRALANGGPFAASRGDSRRRAYHIYAYLGQRDKPHLRYPSDLTDQEWAHVEPLIPPARQGGRKRETNMREALNAVMYVLSTGCQWRYLPRDLPPRSTVYRYFCDWSIDGVLDRIHDALYEKCRELAEREASPTAAIIDSQSVKSAEKDPMRVDGGRTG